MVTVHCLTCDARYETDVPPSGIDRVRRCRECGRVTLERVAEAGAPTDGGEGSREAAAHTEPDAS